ncbi:MAG: c-type cytochrome [Candidatus Eremiobacteraeota bacterium]|nr:c-type cytochrome [Candidatus Eremiobacteraeota bacterium]
MRTERLILVMGFAFAAVACASGGSSQTPPVAAAKLYDPAALPPGPLGAQIVAGHDLFENTHARMPSYVTARMNCSACHVNAGTVARAGDLVGVYAHFPQWNKRARRVIALQDRIAECFLYSMDGTPPAHDSKEMNAMVAYISWISRGTPVLASPDPGVDFKLPEPSVSPNVANGATIYAQKCASCHQANGNGLALSVPPLWGRDSFNAGAGMHRLGEMAGFVHYNMPQNAPGSLTPEQSYDVAAFVLKHARPAFAKNRAVSFPSQPASFF